MKKKITLDCGHMGSYPLDMGAIGVLKDGSKINECDVVLKICNKTLLLLQGDFDVALTRTGDLDQSLQDKCDISNSRQSALFISVHNNSFTNDASGDEVLYKSPNGKIISNLINEEIKKQIPENKNRGLKHRQNLYVLNQTAAIASLVECGFISSQADFLNDGKNLDRYALAIANGVRAYYDMPPITLDPVEPTEPEVPEDDYKEWVKGKATEVKKLLWAAEEILKEIENK